MEKKGERERIAEREREAEKLLKKVYELRLLAEQTAKAPKARASENKGEFSQECRRRRDRGKGKVCEDATILFQPDILQLETRSRLSSRIGYIQRVAPRGRANISFPGRRRRRRPVVCSVMWCFEQGLFVQKISAPESGQSQPRGLRAELRWGEPISALWTENMPPSQESEEERSVV